VPAGRHSTLTPEVVQTASELAADGMPLDFIADAIGVHRKTCLRWVREAEQRGADELKIRFRSAVFTAHRNTATELLGSIRKSATDGNVWAATWMLTHHPAFRDQFSDAAAERRAAAAAMMPVAKALATLPPEQRLSLIMAIEAEGGSLPEADDEPGS
jgi:DNA-directed RNA polymerase specialized sigma24 family protein